VVVEADGGSRGNPGPAGYGAVLRDAATGDVVAEAAASIGTATNNVAEYRGLIAGLELYRHHTPDAHLEVRLDSKLVVEQMAGRWRVKHPDIKPLALQARRMAPADATWTWVPREQNKHADRLANEAMDAAARGEDFVVDTGAPYVAARPANAEAGAEGRPDDDPDRSGSGPPSRPDRRTTGTSPNRSGDPTPESLEPPSSGVETDRGALFGWSGLLGTPTTLIFLRHGVTMHTAELRFSGPGGDDPGLIDEGHAQALRAAQVLAADGGVDAILTSPLRRTRDTAGAVASALGLPVQVEDDFRECAFGQWDGLTLQEVRERWPEHLAGWLASMEVRPPGGESIVEVQERVEKALARTLAEYQGKTVVVVSHVNPIKLSVRYCLDAPLESINRMDLAPASLTTLSFYDSGASSLRQFSALP
jgi:probable phosphoglycerate mutase